MTSILWTSADAGIITGGANTKPWAATGIAMTIENLKPGDLYIASLDDDLQTIFEKGAAAAMVPENIADHPQLPLLKVRNIFQALQEMASAARFSTHATILAVQGKRARDEISEVLEKISTVHRAGRHMSLSMAQMPENYDFGVFGLAPSLRPDIAVITRPSEGGYGAIFETKTPPRCVILNLDCEGAVEAVSRAQAAGVPYIYTYGETTQADACITETVCADNGVRVTCDILGEQVHFMKPKSDEVSSVILVPFLMMKLMDMGVQKLARQVSLNTIGSELRKPQISMLTAQQAVLQVANVIDFGCGRRTAVLDGLKAQGQSLRETGFSIPQNIDNLNLVLASKSIPVFSNARDAIRRNKSGGRLESIVPDVLSPGDFVIFKDIWKSSRAVFDGALRLVPNQKTTPAYET